MSKTSNRKPTTVAALLASLALVCGSAQAGQATDQDDPHAKHRAMMKKPQPEDAVSTAVELSDQVLVTRHGESIRFVEEVIADRIVVINFIYTTCTTVCPITSAIFGQVQSRLGDELGENVVLVSMSVDPGRDTPERLKAYADGLKASPDWIWLTGDKPVVDDVLRGLGAYTPNFEDHPAMVLVGDERSGTWRRFFGFPAPGKIVATVKELEHARQMANMQQ